MTLHKWLELSFVCLGIVGTLGMFLERIVHKKSAGARSIQFVVG
jgi:hypothetical protein